MTLATEASDSSVGLTVTDTGEGIGDETLPQLFIPFFSTKPTGQGTGLGLPMVERYIKAHDGSIEVESRVGSGTVMIVKLPKMPTEDSSDGTAGETIDGSG